VHPNTPYIVLFVLFWFAMLGFTWFVAGLNDGEKLPNFRIFAIITVWLLAVGDIALLRCWPLVEKNIIANL